MAKPISILVADKHTLFAKALAESLEEEPDLHVVAVVGNGDDVVKQAAEYKPDVVLLDIDMPGLYCFEAARLIVGNCPNTAVVFVSAYTRDYYIGQALEVEAAGYLTKNEPPEAVKAAIRKVASGGAYFSPEVQSRMTVSATGAGLAEATKGRSQRALAVLRQITEKLSNRRKAGRTYPYNLMKTLNVRGWAEPPPSARAVPLGHGKVVLLAEANRRTRRLITAMLRSWDYDVVTPPDGATCHEAFKKDPDQVAVLIMKVDPPERAGLECLRKIRAAGYQTPVILTGETFDAEVEAARDAVTVLLRKPFQMAEFGVCLSKLLADRKTTGDYDMTKPISILIADDHALFAKTFADSLEEEPDLHVVAVVENGDDAVKQAVEHKPDIVLLDIDMPGLYCFEAARLIVENCPNTAVVFVSAYTRDYYIGQALEVEAAGYLTKNEPPDVVKAAIRNVASGGAYYSPEVQSRIIVGPEGASLAQPVRTRLSLLTVREVAVLRYIAQGLTKGQIAEQMSITVNTVETHAYNLMEKLDIHDRVELTRFAIREGLVRP